MTMQHVSSRFFEISQFPFGIVRKPRFSHTRACSPYVNIVPYRSNRLLLLASTHLPLLMSASSLSFSFTSLFLAYLNLGPSSKPISIPSGILITEPITNGTASGPAINATIQGGFVHPPIWENNTVQGTPSSTHTEQRDARSFYIHEEGVGTNGP